MDPTVLRDTVLDYALRTLWAVVVVAIALVLARAVRGVTMRRLTSHRAQGNATVLLGNLAQLGVIVLGILIVLAIYTQGAFGWILTSFSIVGIVIGLSLQEIDVSGYTGLVEEISFRTTLLRTDDGRQVIVPNGDFMTKPVVNLTRFPLRRGLVYLTVDASTALSTDDLRTTVASVAAIAGDPAPKVELHRVASGKARYQITFWAADHDAAVAAAVAAIRARFPKGEVRAA